MRKTLLISSIILMVVSCGQHDNKKIIADSLASDSTYNRQDRWLDYYNLSLKDFTDSLPLVEMNTIGSDYDFKSDSNTLFKKFFIFSPDSAHFIDLDSYSIVLEKDSIGRLFSKGSEVDLETSLIDIEGKERIRILFCGTDCRPEEAHWIRNDLVHILGTTKNGSIDYPTIWTFEIKNHFFQEIKSRVAIDLTGEDYVSSVRLKMIKFIK
jgi:hypothetical protein